MPIEDGLNAVVIGADAVVVFAGHDLCTSIQPAELVHLCGKDHPVIVDGWNIIDPDRFIAEGFVFRIGS